MADKNTPKGPLRSRAPVDTSIISAEEQKKLYELAAAEVGKEKVVAAKARLMEDFRNQLRQQGGVDEPNVQIYIDLAPYVDRITIDNVIYMQGTSPTVRLSVADSMLDMMARTWKHQAEIDGKSENHYRRSSHTVISPNGVSNILRA